jgi:hypothetical protein
MKTIHLQQPGCLQGRTWILTETTNRDNLLVDLRRIPLETIAYVAPSAAGTIESQIARLRPLVSEDRYVRVDRPKKKKGVLLLPRTERDFVFAHMLRSAADNLDGKPDKLVVVSVDVLGDNRAEIDKFFYMLLRIRVPFIALDDGLTGELGEAEAIAKWVKALDRAEGRWERQKKAARPKRRVRKGTATGGRPKTLAPQEIKEVIRLKEVERLTWPQISAHFAALGRKVAPSTLSGYYLAATVI